MAFENIEMTNSFFAKEGARHRPVESRRDKSLILIFFKTIGVLTETYFHISPVVATYIFSNRMMKDNGTGPTIGVENSGTQKTVRVGME